MYEIGSSFWMKRSALFCRGATLRVEELSGPDALEAITPEWEELDAHVSPRTPFTSPLWAKLWWRHLRQKGPAIRQEFFVHTVRDEAGKLLAIAPLVITHRPGFGPLQFRLLQFFGETDGGITDHRCLLCREQDEPRMIDARAKRSPDPYAGAPAAPGHGAAARQLAGQPS